MTKNELIAQVAALTAELEAANATVALARTHYRALQDKVKAYMLAETAPVTAPTKKTPHLKAVKSFATVDEMRAWAGDGAAKFIITQQQGGGVVANLREWV